MTRALWFGSLFVVAALGGEVACSSDDAVAPASSDAGGADATSSPVASGDAATSSDAAADDPEGVFVAVGYGGRRIRSTDDGLTWTDDQVTEPDGGGDDMELLRTVAYGDGKFLAAGWKNWSSSDGQTWTALPATKQNWFGALAHTGSRWVAVGGYGMRLESADGATWKNHALDTIAAHPHGCLVVVGTSLVACNDNGARSWSTDGETWIYATGALDSGSSELAVGNGVVVGIGGTKLVTSTDGGKTWTAGTPFDTVGGGLVFANGHFTHLGTNAVYTSSDGNTWTKTTAMGVSPAALTFGHGTYVAVAGHTFWRSTDGTTWTSRKEALTVNSLQWVTFGPRP
jgi:hypothetical protein